MFQFVDEELPSQYYEELVFDAYTMFNLWQENQLKHDEDTQNDIVKIMEDLTFTKSKIKFYDRLFICLVILCVCYVVAAFAP